MKVKTYGIHGLSEWYGDVKAGSISVKLHFTGGTASPSGALPAYMVTKDPVTQFVIENSKEFKNGFIHLAMSQDIPGEHPRMAVPKNTTEPSKSEDAPTANPETETKPSSYPNVTTAQAARELLKAEYGGTTAELQTAAAIRAFAEKKGVTFPNWN